MFRELHKDSSMVRILLVLLIIALCAHLFSLFWQFISIFSDVIGILIISWLLSFVLEPLVDNICHITNAGKVFATALTYLLIFLAFLFIGLIFIPLVTEQVVTLSHTLPQFLATSPPFMAKWTNGIIDTVNNSIVYIPSIAQFLVSTLIVLVISFYFIIDKDRINREFFYLTPLSWHERMRFMQKIITNTFASFLRIQIIIGILTGVVTWLVLWALGVPFAIAIALLAGVLGAIPLIGPILAVIPPLFFTFIIDPWLALIALIILTIIQQVIFNVFVPRAFGKAFKMHPIIILLASIVGFRVGGPLGAIFAIPVAGISAVVIRDLWRYFLKQEDQI